MTLKKSFVWLMSGQIVFSAMQFVVMILLARFATVEDIGAYSLALALTTPIVAFSSLGLRAVMTTEVLNKFPEAHYFWLRLWGNVFAFFGVLVVAFSYQQSHLVFWYIIFLGLAKICENFSDIYYAAAQKRGRLDWVSKSLVLRGILGTGVLGGMLLVVGDSSWAFFGYAFVWFLVLLGYDMRMCCMPKWRPFLGFATLKPLFMFALPLGMASVLYMVAQNSVRYIVEYKLGLEALGEFSAVAYVLVVGQIVISVMGQTVRLKLAELKRDGDLKNFWRISRFGIFGSFLMGGGLSFAAWLVGDIGLHILYGPSFVHLQPLLLAICLGSAFLFCGTFLGFVLSALNAYWWALAFSMLGVFSGFGSSIVLIPAYGLFGAAYSVAILGCVLCCAFPVIAYLVKNKVIR